MLRWSDGLTFTDSKKSVQKVTEKAEEKNNEALKVQERVRPSSFGVRVCLY